MPARTSNGCSCRSLLSATNSRAAVAEIANWWEGARGPYLEAYDELDEHTRAIVDALEEVLRTQRHPPDATKEG